MSHRQTHAQPLVNQLHWLPIRQRITCKLAVLCCKVQTSLLPTSTDISHSDLLPAHLPLLTTYTQPKLVTPSHVTSETIFRPMSCHATHSTVDTFKRHPKTHSHTTTNCSVCYTGASSEALHMALYLSTIRPITIIKYKFGDSQ